MRKNIIRMSLVALMTVLGIGMVAVPSVMAEDEETKEYRTSLTISPASKTLELKSNMTEDGVLAVTNDGDSSIVVEVYAAPYSYTYSEEDDEYRLGYSHENSFTQLSRWVKIKNKDGVYETKPSFTIKPGETEQVSYRITTPDDIPAGGQYAVIFAQVKSSSSSTAGAIRADPSLGMIMYGRSSEGEVITSAEFRDMKLGQGFKTEGDGENEAKKSIFYGTAKVKNTGNVDFFAQGILEVTPIIGFSSYKTSSDKGMVSIIPETELTISDQWEEMPSFGIYKAVWTVTGGGETQTMEQMIFLFPPIAIILMLLVLTIIIVGVIMLVKRRKAKKSRLAI